MKNEEMKINEKELLKKIIDNTVTKQELREVVCLFKPSSNTKLTDCCYYRDGYSAREGIKYLKLTNRYFSINYILWQPTRMDLNYECGIENPKEISKKEYKIGISSIKQK